MAVCYPEVIDWLSADNPLPLQLEIATAFGAFLDPVADKIM
jgi:hypothetical protein